MSEHFIPFRKHDILRLVHEGRSGGPESTQVTTLIDLVLGQEFQGRLTRLKELYQPLDPNRDTLAIPNEQPRAADPGAFREALAELLGRANFAQLGQAELDAAFATESVFKVKLHTALGDFSELTIHARGKRMRQETVTSLFGFKKRTIDVEYYERVLLFVRFQDEAYFTAQKRTKLAFTPGSTVLKLFANVPAADLEMLFPNSEVRMKTLDKAIIGLPAIIGVLTMSAKILVVIGFLWAGLKWVGAETGLHHEQVDVSKLAAEAGLVLAACAAIYMFVNRQLMRYRFKKLQFIKALSDNLYFRNLDNNAGVFHRILDDALDEDVKEAVLAWRFLNEGSTTAAGLDAKIEAWFRTRLGATVDYEVEDGLGKLERLGLATRSGELWSAVSPAEAAARLQERWRQFTPG